MSQTLSRKKLVGGYDGHGVTSTVAAARSQRISLSDVIIKFPDTSPELAPKLLYSLNLYNAEIQMFDIAINVKNPAEWFSLMSIVASNNDVTIYDHHETNLKFLSQLPRNIKLIQFSSASEMAKALMESFNAERELLLLGVITDRDSEIKKLIDVESREFNQMYNYANVLDVMIRQNLEQTVRGIYEEGISYVIRQANSVQYPPYSLANQLAVQKHGNIIYVDATGINLAQWIWKVWDELLRRNSSDYLVAVAQILDRQINQMIPAVFVVKYWLSDAPSPRPLIAQLIANRKVIGHDDAFSISATSVEDARLLAQQVISALESNFSSSVSLIPSSNVARAIQTDFAKILSKLGEILEEQRKMYAEYLELKRRQVELLERTEDTRRRGD